jgi:hypothetical protein
VKIIRDALLETEPFSSKASFIFQLHPDAQRRLRDAWRHEDLRSLDIDDPLNEPVVVVLQGLTNLDSAILVAHRYLDDPDVHSPGHKNGTAPFTEGALNQIWAATQPRPRWFLRALHQVLQFANTKRPSKIDEKFVSPLLASLTRFAREEDEGETDVDDTRLA